MEVQCLVSRELKIVCARLLKKKGSQPSTTDDLDINANSASASRSVASLLLLAVAQAALSKRG